MDQSDTQKFCDQLRNFTNAMLITKADGGKLRARPMAIAEVADDGSFCFLTARDTAKVHEIESDTLVHVACQNDQSLYLSINGLATLSGDTAKIESVWSEGYKTWFPAGPNDPNIALIVVNPIDAEYWDTTGGKKLDYLWEVATGYLSGTTPDIKEGEQHGMLKP